MAAGGNRGRTRAPVPPGSAPGRASATPIARFGQAGSVPGGRAMVAIVASSAQASLRGGSAGHPTGAFDTAAIIHLIDYQQ